jgi:cell wall-associated NlpC family hydrolase
MSTSQVELDARLDAAVAVARERIAQAYPVVVDTTCWRWRKGELRVRGGVLARAQAEIYRRVLSDQLDHPEVPPPLVLSELDSLWQLHRWLPVLGEEVVDLLRSAEGELQTQWQPPAWVRHFADDPGAGLTLVQLADATLGWMNRERLDFAAAGPLEDPWAGFHRPTQQQSIAPVAGTPAAARRVDGNEALAREARSWLGSPYLWGGNTREAADCSGFVQSVLRSTCGLLLPKNTADQQRYGKSIDLADLRAGDLVFVTGKEHGLRHVALVLEAEADPTTLTVIHASMSRNLLLEERLDIFMPRHEFTCARRILHWPEER